MSTTTYDTATVATSPSTSVSGRTPIWRVGALAAIVAAVAAELFAVAAKAIDIPMETAGFSNGAAEEIPAGGFAFSVVLWTAVGTVLAAVLARRAQRPARTFVVTTVILTALSMVSPLMANETTTASVVALCLSHLVAAAVVIPVLATRLEGEGRSAR
jgi:Family of unknown function (DUF6069)